MNAMIEQWYGDETRQNTNIIREKNKKYVCVHE